MKCSDIDKKIHLYDLLDVQERAAVDTHVAACAACRTKLDGALQMQKLIHAAARHKPEPDNALFLTERIMRSVERVNEKRNNITVWSWLNTLAKPPVRIAYGIVSMLIIVGFVHEANRPMLQTTQTLHRIKPATGAQLNTTAFLNNLKKRAETTHTLSVSWCLRVCQATNSSPCNTCKTGADKNFYADL